MKLIHRPRYQEATAQDEQFVRAFIDVAYESMAIENEAPFSREEAYARYREDALDLVRDGTSARVRLTRT